MNPTDVAIAGAQYFECLDRGLYVLALKVLFDNPEVDILSLSTPADIEIIKKVLDSAERAVQSKEMKDKCLTVRERLGGLWAYCAACGTFSKINHPIGNVFNLPFSHVGTHVCKECECQVIVDPMSIIVIAEGYLI